MRLKKDMNICMVILLKSYKNDHCRPISNTVIIRLLLNVLKGPLAYQIKTTTTIVKEIELNSIDSLIQMYEERSGEYIRIYEAIVIEFFL